MYLSLSLSFFPLLPLSSHKSSRFASIFDRELQLGRSCSLHSPRSLYIFLFSRLSYARYTRHGIYTCTRYRLLESGKFLMGVLCGAYQPRFIQEDILGLSWLANWFCTLIPRTVGTSARFLPPVVPRGWFSWTSRWAGHPGRLSTLFTLFARHFIISLRSFEYSGVSLDFLED